MTTGLQLEGISDPRVLSAMRDVPRDEFVPHQLRAFANDDRPLPIGENQTISQPYIVARMTELLGVKPTDRVLEIGTGSGYQTAILSVLAQEVCTVEVIPALAERAQRDLTRLGLTQNVHFQVADGYWGWAERAPFDCIIVTAAPKFVPAPLQAQLADGGRLVIPVGDQHQVLQLLERNGDNLVARAVLPVRFVPMTGLAERGH